MGDPATVFGATPAGASTILGANPRWRLCPPSPPRFGGLSSLLPASSGAVRACCLPQTPTFVGTLGLKKGWQRRCSESALNFPNSTVARLCNQNLQGSFYRCLENKRVQLSGKLHRCLTAPRECPVRLARVRGCPRAQDPVQGWPKVKASDNARANEVRGSHTARRRLQCCLQRESKCSLPASSVSSTSAGRSASVVGPGSDQSKLVRVPALHESRGTERQATHLIDIGQDHLMPLR